MIYKKPYAEIFLSWVILSSVTNFLPLSSTAQYNRQRNSINYGWRFMKGDPADANGLVYDVRPESRTTAKSNWSPAQITIKSQ